MTPAEALVRALDTFGEAVSDPVEAGSRWPDVMAASASFCSWLASEADRSVARAINIAVAKAEDDGALIKSGDIARAALRAIFGELAP